MEERYDKENAAYPLRMPKEFEIEGFLVLPIQDLFDLLNSRRTTEVFRSLCALSLKNLTDPLFRTPENQTLLKHIAAEGITFKNRKLAYNLFHQLYPDQLDSLTLGQSKQIGFVYFIQEKKYDSIKIGRSLNFDRRLSNFVTDLPYRVELVGYIRSINYENIELAFHKHFRYKRLGGEWFKLSPEEILDLKQHRFPKNIEELIIKDY